MSNPLPPLALVALLTVSGAPHSRAVADDDDHTRARALMREGRIVPLAGIVSAARERTGGEVIDVELEDEDHHHDRRLPDEPRFLYEVKVLTPDGRLIKLDYDARTGRLWRERVKR